MMYMSTNETDGVTQLMDRIDMCHIKNQDLVFSTDELYILKNLLGRVRDALKVTPPKRMF
jgi:hypothetical protein